MTRRIAGLLVAMLVAGCSGGQARTAPPSVATASPAPTGAAVATATATPTDAPTLAPSLGPAPAGKIVFGRQVGGEGFQIFVISADGTGEQRLFDELHDITRVSHDGTRLATVSFGLTSVFTTIVDVDGTNPLELHPDKTLNLGAGAWSRDDQWLACEAWDETDHARDGIWLVRADGTGLKRLTDPGIPGDFSPDDKQLVFTREQEGTFVIDVDGKNERKISDMSGPYPGFMPDGSIYTASRGSFWILDAATGAARRSRSRAADRSNRGCRETPCRGRSRSSPPTRTRSGSGRCRSTARTSDASSTRRTSRTSSPTGYRDLTGRTPLLGSSPDVTNDTLAQPADDLREVLADEAAFRRWYDRMIPSVYSYVASRCLGDEDLAQELTQQTFIAAIHGRARFDSRSEPVTWLCGIARHKLADHFRRLERDEARARRVAVQAIALDGADEASRWRDVDDRILIAETLRRLPAAQRAVLTFVALDDLPVAEAARLLGKSFGATQSLLARARESFRQAYPRGVEP